MAYQLWIADAARAAGLKVIEEAGWRTRGGSVFEPKGVICHHTAIDSDSSSVKTVLNGRPDLAGPLSQFVLGKDGVVYIIASGRSNHAGEGKWREMTGNSTSFGIEAVNKGDGTPWPEVQLDAYHILCAVLLKHMRRPAEDIAGHREFALPIGRKIDPKGIDMTSFRFSVAAILKMWDTPKDVKPMFDPPLILEPIAASVKLADGRVYLGAVSGAIYGFEVPPIRGANGQAYFVGRKAAKLFRSEEAPAPDGIDKTPGGVTIQTTDGAWYGPYRASP